ncbi:MotA/TolQ/ExbB proton channel family protein [Litorimonas cladophorae]|uniref:MotA/TolQ/ExbB proton channel family protein n=1 Tax=Litorimonas cladophorae TaxID=1220491 RepID=UPI001F1F15CB|nr:MotA/TolQ/ExbB proton channel family protein [Litorimonas cladophorae]
MSFLILFVIGLTAILLVPSLIVIFWKRRPILAFAVGATVAYLTMVAPGIIKTFQARMIYGTGDPELMAAGISEALVNALFSLPITLPVLALIQWIARRRFKKKQALSDKAGKDVFS